MKVFGSIVKDLTYIERQSLSWSQKLHGGFERCKCTLRIRGFSQWDQIPSFKAKFQLFLYTYDFTRILFFTKSDELIVKLIRLN